MDSISKPGVPIPSYLSSFETEFDKIHLIHAKKPSVSSDNVCGSPIKNESIQEEKLDDCELTGDPLKIDLGEDDFIHMEKAEQVAYSWSVEETKHFPFTVREARREINKILKKPERDPDSLPVYVVCNGDDPNKTILLGADRETLMSCGIHALRLIELKDNSIDTEEMVNDHYKRFNKIHKKVNHIVKMKFQVYGQSLGDLPCQNELMRDFDKHASISVNVTSDQQFFRVLKNTILNMSMDVEIVAGHKLLGLNSLWGELCTLQNYLNILLNSDLSTNQDTLICRDFMDSDIILQNISNLVTTKCVRRRPTKDTIDLKNLRLEDFLDKLWKILKYCENIYVLRNSIQYLFEELATSNIQLINIKDTFSGISLIINGILERNVALPNITLQQSVELLFELGAQKLKFDFLVILDHFYYTAKKNIESVWKMIYETNTKKTDDVTRRTIKATQYLNAGNVVVKRKQLAYLCQLYAASEFIFFVKEQVSLKQDCFDSFCQYVGKLYVQNSNVFKDFLEILQRPLCKMTYVLDKENIEIITGVHPSSWALCLTSKDKFTELTSLYLLTESPIFPPTIYNFDIPVAKENIVYYMHLMNRKKSFFPMKIPKQLN